MILLGCGTDDAAAIARRILSDALSGGSGTYGVVPFSMTIGISAMPEPAHDHKQVLHQATAALAWGKRHGRTDVQVLRPGPARDGRRLAAAGRAGRSRRAAWRPTAC